MKNFTNAYRCPQCGTLYDGKKCEECGYVPRAIKPLPNTDKKGEINKEGFQFGEI